MILLVQTSPPLKRPYEKNPGLSHAESPIRVLPQPAHKCGDGSVQMNEESSADDESFQKR